MKKLIGVKQFIALGLTGAFIYLAVTNKLDTAFLGIYTLVVGAYFSKDISERVDKIENKDVK